MAKISANGEREHLRFEGKGGETVVLTARRDGTPGRLLHKRGSSGGYSVANRFFVRTRTTLAEASIEATEFAMQRGLASAPLRS